MGASYLRFSVSSLVRAPHVAVRIGGSCRFGRVPGSRRWTRAGRNSRPDTTAAYPLARAASLDQLLADAYVMDTGSAVQPVAGQRPLNEVLSLVLAEMAGEKRRDGKALLHQSKTTLGAKVNGGRVYVRSGDFSDQAADRPVS